MTSMAVAHVASTKGQDEGFVINPSVTETRHYLRENEAIASYPPETLASLLSDILRSALPSSVSLSGNMHLRLLMNHLHQLLSREVFVERYVHSYDDARWISVERRHPSSNYSVLSITNTAFAMHSTVARDIRVIGRVEGVFVSVRCLSNCYSVDRAEEEWMWNQRKELKGTAFSTELYTDRIHPFCTVESVSENTESILHFSDAFTPGCSVVLLLYTGHSSSSTHLLSYSECCEVIASTRNRVRLLSSHPGDSVAAIASAIRQLDPLPYDDLSYVPEFGFQQKQTYQPGEYNRLYLDTYSFNDRTVLVGAEDETAALLEAGRDPGLGVRSLQARGITGQGVKIAIIDQSLLTDHPEISGAIAAYCETGIDSGLNEGTLHGPAVASILAGQTVGVAPGVQVYYMATPGAADSRPHADALRHILEINETLPEGEKIRAVSVSAAPGDRDLFENADLWRDALADAEAAGLLVLTAQAAGSARLTLSTSTFDLTRRDSPAACKTGLPNDSGMLAARKSPFCLGLPCAYRTVAEEYVPGQCGYRYDAVGGLSWGIPYCVGVMAVGWQVAPALTNEEMLQTLLDTAAPNADGLRIIDPVHFIETLEREYAS